jgi:hypothetical protein
LGGWNTNDHTGDGVALYEASDACPGRCGTKQGENWIAFQVRSPKGIRNAVTVRREGVSFFTEDQLLLEELKSAGLDWYKILPDESKSKRRFRFTKLTPETVEKHSDDFRKLFAESVKLKLFYS